MRILLIADIHSNWPALAAIDEQFDEGWGEKSAGLFSSPPSMN